jgi:peptidoglycan/LPS O-acetylase OafA/YrhL
VTSTLVADLREVGRRLTAGALGGLICGLVIGGIGGRLAMFVLRVTSGADVVGIESDDGFTIGAFSSASIFLLGITAITGALIGILYAVARGWMPDRIRPLATAVLLAVVGGAAVIHPGGVDFTRLSPLWLAVVLFILLPGLFGLALSSVVDRLWQRPPGRILPLLGLGAILVVVALAGVGGGVGLLIAVALFALFLVGLIGGRRMPGLRKVGSSAPVVWLGRGVLAAGGIFAAARLVRSVVEIL